MAFTRILGPGIHTASNINSHNIKSTGIITAVSFVGNLTGGASSITGTPHVSLGNVNAGIATFTGALSGTTANFSGNVTVGGVLTYEDVKNVDSLGIITARSGVDVDDFLVESIRKPSLDYGAFNVFRSVFNPSGPQGLPLDKLFAKLNSPLLLLWGGKDPWMNTPKKRNLYKKFTPKNTQEIILDAGH